MIYFVQAGEGGPIKIGFTARDPARRRSELQSDCPSVAILLGSIPGDEDDETRLQIELKQYHIHGDWFHPHPSVLSLIEHRLSLNPVAISKPQISNLKTLRKKLRESQTVFGQRFGVEQSTVHRWETDGLPDRGTSRMAVERTLAELETQASAA